jgi:hypothetical protein
MTPQSKDAVGFAFQRLALLALLASGTYLVLLSPAVFMIHRLSSWVKTLIFTLPWLLLCLAYQGQVLRDQTRRLEIILMGSVLILGGVNVIYSDAPLNSYENMKFFLASGVLALWTSMFLLADPKRRQVFDWFCCGCLAIFAPLEILSYLPRPALELYDFSRLPEFLQFDYTGSFPLAYANYVKWLTNIFTLHSTPVGTLVILLSVGPISLTLSDSGRRKIVGWLLISLGLFLILLTHKRGTFLAVAAMLLVWLAYRLPRLGYLTVAAFLAVVLLFTYRGLQDSRSLALDHPSRVSKLHRLELYSFAWHVYKKHALLGIGLRPQTHEKYLDEYQQRQPEMKNFARQVKLLQTFDNMLVTALVELGSLMTLVYLGLVVLIIHRFWRQVRPYQESRGRDFFRLLPLVGLAVHSLIYDTLLFPQINWLFNVQLGILAGWSHAEQGEPKRHC